MTIIKPPAILVAALRKLAERREPDVTIGTPQQPYLRRWWLIPRNRFCNVYLHHFLRSDDDRALHDHPWWNISWLLDGSYKEVVPVNPAEPSGPVTVHFRERGSLVRRKAEHAHRITLLKDDHGAEVPCWSLFITGPKIREWGFWCPKGWRHWHDFTGFRQNGHGREIGPGCGEP